MAAQRKFTVLAALTNAVANVLNGAITSLAGSVGITFTQPRITIRHMRILNKTGSAATFSMWLGATGASAAGTEVGWNTYSVPANSFVDWYGELVMDSTQFLTAQASANTTLTLNVDCEAGFS